MTEKEKIDYNYEHNPLFRKFYDDKALERVNTLASAAHMLIQIAMTFEAETETILEKYHLFVHDIKGRAKNLGKAYDQYQYAMSQFYSSKMKQNFMAEYDKMLSDMYVYLGIDKEWKPGMEDTHKFLGFQNAFLHCLKQKGRKGTKYIGRTPTGNLWISTKPSGKAYPLPKGWFSDLKNGEIRKVNIEPLIKY